MAERISKSQLVGLFDLYCRKFGFKQSKSRPRVGDRYVPPSPGLVLNQTHDGWEILGYDGKSSGVSQPITSRLYDSREIWIALHFAIASLDAHERRHTGTGR